MKQFLVLSKFNVPQILKLINQILQFKKNKNAIPSYQNIVATNIFIEPSTRTFSSFFLAEQQCNMIVLPFTPEQSSFQKKESFNSTIETLCALGVKLFVIRSSVPMYWNKITCKAFLKNEIAIVNGGDGTGNHPSQLLLDLVTIYEHFKKLSNLTILIIGDISHSRVYHSYQNIANIFGFTLKVFEPNIFGAKEKSLDSLLKTADVIYLLRVQFERHTKKYNIENYNEKYGLNKQRLLLIAKTSIIMHPGPYNIGLELTSDVLGDSRCKINEQVTNGLFTRIAIIDYVLK